ncbi:hypothetical protein [Peptoniphilus sp. HCN-40583]|uniref:hypothetical protein n=1 Tax=Peptoniphilus sp. HCN-40583 TaxID=3134662 RepID=UPI0030BDEC02
MMEPKFYPYLTEKKARTEHGYKYIVLKEETPTKLKEEYMEIVANQDERLKRGEMIIMF